MKRWLARPLNATRAWLWLLILTVLCLALAAAGRGQLPWMGWGVAALVWLKARLVALHYLEVLSATAVFRRIVAAFIALTPLALAATAWLERAH